MQKQSAPYRERLAPSLWTLVAAAMLAPMGALVLVPVDATLSLVVGLALAVVVITGLIAASPVVDVRAGTLRAGRAQIESKWLGAPVAHTGDAARRARGAEIDGNGWHLIRGGIPGLVVVPVQDPEDPVTSWTISTRTPDRLAAAIERARATTPRSRDR
ncbi:DUF3093 domain-containing protein [Microbacterium sp. LRZ72]|uniref:DUF3093 domain-containing protein n=1 Tax=Microbacterium sp. LRZ72 TaxID=2942481 RepID=UPI0029A25648|nr:DUF3093 domain-containing protein [Microbacterium sp. LRZ72]MDX2375341.1 DUF3093 domain-containing protein [Microbacterium sp. LRZ72]